jgi:predicted sugar kinase
MKKQIFRRFIPGTVFNPLGGRYFISNKLESVNLTFPSRLNAMAIDPSKITSNENMIFTPGEVVFSVKIYKRVFVKITKKKNIVEISKESQRKQLITHAVRLIQKALNVNDGLYVSVDNKNELKHSGLGSSGALIAGVASAINELYGKPIPNEKLVEYLAQNHGEEIETSNRYIQQVQCIGGSAWSGNAIGGLMIIAGKSKLIATMKVPSEYKVVIGIPIDYKPLDSEKMMKLEEKNLNKFLYAGKRYGGDVAYRMLHEAIPAMFDQNLIPIGNLIFDYRFKMGSIKNCAFSYPKMTSIAKIIAHLKNETDTPILSLSSVGPAFFAITKKTNIVSKAFENVGMKTMITEIENGKYKVHKTKNDY